MLKELFVAIFIILGLGGMVYLIKWLMNRPVPPDPWDKAVDKQELENSAMNLCHNCFTLNDKNIDFCKKCRTPLSAYVTLDPFKHIEATSNTLVKAVKNPKLISVIGIWLLFGTTAIFPLFSLFMILKSLVFPVESERTNYFEQGITVIILLPVLIICSLMIVKVTRNYYRNRP